MPVHVECYAGHCGEEDPPAFSLGERRFEVREPLDRWLAPTQRCFEVHADDARVFILRHDKVTREWQLAGLVGRCSPGSGDGATRH